MKTHYSSGLQTVDFVREAEAARQAINAWVEKETERKITELVGPGALDPLTRLVLCNAIYFKGNWASPFDVELTRWTDFFLAVDRPVNALMMRQEMEIKHKQLSGLAAAELPYKGDQLAMVVLLPTNRDGLAGLEKSLSAGNLKEWLGGIDKSGATSVMVSLPKFKTTSSFDLVENLEKMGMRSAFGQAADFSGMTGNRDLFISRILHKAFVEVNEEGTEAAAATSATGDGKDRGPEVMVFNANHPFIFLIRERQTGSILFMGRMADPTK
jgi:serpin B